MSLKDWQKKIDAIAAAAASGAHVQEDIDAMLQDFTAAVAKGMNGHHARGIATLLVRSFGRTFYNEVK